MPTHLVEKNSILAAIQEQTKGGEEQKQETGGYTKNGKQGGDRDYI